MPEQLTDEQRQIQEEFAAATDLQTSGKGDSPEPVTPPTGQEQEDSEANTAVTVASEPPVPSLQDLALAQDPAAYQALTEADERQITAEIEGRALGAMVYSYKQGGGTVTGLSWKGVQEAVRQMNTRRMGRIKIDAQPPVFEEITVDVDTGKKDEDGQPLRESKRAVRCTVYAVDEVFGSGRYGTATQLREFKQRKPDKKGNPIWATDTFADAKALSKAQRNAMEGMLPLQLVEELKTLYLGRGSVEYIEATAVVTNHPPALTDERATELGDEIRELYEQVKRVHPEGLKALPPGQFNRYFTAAQHDHQRLEEFKAFMVEQVEKAEEAAA